MCKSEALVGGCRSQPFVAVTPVNGVLCIEGETIGVFHADVVEHDGIMTC